MARENFTTRRVSLFQCATGKTQSLIWDGGAPGLGLRATANGAKAYVFQSRLDGETIRVTIGDPATWTLSQAREEATRLKLMVDTGTDPRKQKAERLALAAAQQAESAQAAAKESLLARTAWDDYLAAPHPDWGTTHRSDHITAADVGGSACKIGSRTKKPGPLASLLHLPLHSITTPVIREWVARESQTRPTATLNAYRKFRTFINWCVLDSRYKTIAHADCCATGEVKTSLPKSKSKANDVLQREQLALWFGAVRGLANPVLSAYLQALLITGARRNELSELKWSDADFKWNSLQIRDKIEGSRTIPLTPYLGSILKNLPQNNEWVFSSPTSSSGHIVSPTKAHIAALDAAGLPHVSLHGLRRSFATLSEWVDVPTGVSAQIMGHKPSAIAERHYVQRPLDMLRMWHVKIEAWMMEAAGIVWNEPE